MNFHEYAERKQSELIIERCAAAIAEGDIDPHVFIEEFVSEQGLSEDWNSFKTGVKQAASGAWDMIKNFGPIKSATRVVDNALSDRYTRAMAALKELHQFLLTDETGKTLMSQNNNRVKASDYLLQLMKSLGNETEMAQASSGVNAQNNQQGAPNAAAPNAAAPNAAAPNAAAPNAAAPNAAAPRRGPKRYRRAL